MRSNYKRLGDYIRVVDIRNKDGRKDNLLGVSVKKIFIKSVANTVGTDFRKYKIVKKFQFTYIPDTSRRGDKIGIAMLDNYESALVSQAYTVFEVIDNKKLNPEYLMMWFRRSEFDRYARFKSHGSVREIFDWDEMCDTTLPIPSIEKQREIVKEYNTIVNRIKLNEELNKKLEETAQTIYKNWFVDFDINIKDKVRLEEYIEFNPYIKISKGKEVGYVDMANLHSDRLSINNIVYRKFKSGSKFQNGDTLLARITPCLENGKTAYVDCFYENEKAFGSTEFIVMRAKNKISPYWVYCLAKDKIFRSYAISSMIGSSGRQRVHIDYLKEYLISIIEPDVMKKFNKCIEPLFMQIRLKELETRALISLKEISLARIAKL